MIDFVSFFQGMLNSVAEFMWLDGTRYITGLMVCLCLVGIVKRLFNMSDF